MFCFGGSEGPRGFQTPASSCKSKLSLFTRSVSVWETFLTHPNTDGVSSNRRELCCVPYVQETQHIKKLNHLIMCLKFKLFFFFLVFTRKAHKPALIYRQTFGDLLYIFFLSSSAGAKVEGSSLRASRASAAASSSPLKFAPTKLYTAAIYYSVTPAARERTNTHKPPAAKSGVTSTYSIRAVYRKQRRRASVDSNSQSGKTTSIVGLQSRAAISSVHDGTTEWLKSEFHV